jgi:hypothetical protein
MNINKPLKRSNVPLHSTYVSFRANVPLRAGNMRALIISGKSANADQIVGASRVAQEYVDKIKISDTPDRSALLEADRKSYEIKSVY